MRHMAAFTTVATANKRKQHLCRAADTEAEAQAPPPAAAGTPGSEVYQGHYGPWSIEPEDVAEVWSYRIGLSATVAAFLAAAAIGSTAGDSSSSSEAATAAAAWALNPLVALGAVGMGVSLVQIHIYMTPVKRTLQALWALGVAGAGYLLLSHPEQPLPLLVAQQPWSVWLVGPAAAAVTGVAIKEGICYGKAEAAGLALTLPLLCLAHLSGRAPEQLEQLLLLAVCGAASVFAVRKYTQPIKNDIGDKSVFVYMKQMSQQQQQ